MKGRDRYNYTDNERIVMISYSFSRASTVMRPAPLVKAAAFWIVREQATFNFRSRSDRASEPRAFAANRIIEANFNSKLLLTLH